MNSNSTKPMTTRSMTTNNSYTRFFCIYNDTSVTYAGWYTENERYDETKDWWGKQTKNEKIPGEIFDV